MRKINTYAISLSLAMMTVGAWTFVGCSSDDNIDLGELDKTIGVGSDSFELPNSSTKNSPLSDLLELKEDGVIDTLKRDSAGYHVGDYKFTKADTVKWATPKVKQVKFNTSSGEQHKDLPVKVFSGMSTDPANTIYYFGDPIVYWDSTNPSDLSNLHKLKNEDDAKPYLVKEIDFNGDGNDQIVSLSEATIDGVIKLTLSVEKLMGRVNRIEGIKLYLPKFLKLKPSADFTYDLTTNTDYNILEISNIASVSQPKEVYLNIDHVDDIKDAEPTAATDIEKGYMYFNATGMKMHCTIKMIMKIKRRDIVDSFIPTGTTPNEENIGTDIDMGQGMTVTHAEGHFDPEINIDPTSTGLGDIPDFLENDEVKINLYNPSIKLTVKNNLNAKAYIFGNITAQFKDGTKKRLVLPNIDVEPSTDGNELTTTVVLCRYTPAVPEDPSFKYTQVNNPAESKVNDTLVVNDIAKILNRIPDSLKINLEAKAYTTYDGKIDLYAEGTEDDPNAHGMGYKIKPEYNFTSMLDLENGSVIIYNDSIQDWNKDIADNKIDLYDNAYLMVTADIHNSTPLNLYITSPRLFGLEAYPDNYPVPELRGKRMPINDAQVEMVDENDKVIKSLPVYKDGDSKNKKLRLRIKGNIEKLDGILYEVSAKAEQPTHEILNAQKHRVKIDNMKIALKGRVSIDLDK